MEQAVESIRLENDLILTIGDLSRKVAADRWQVELTAVIAIPVEARWFGPHLPAPAQIDDLRTALGDEVRFVHRNTRNFIDARDRETVFNRMRDSLKINAAKYYGHPDFAARFLIRQYRIHLSRPRERGVEI